MATITPTLDRDTASGAVIATWPAMATGDVGASVPISYAADLTCQVSGTIGGSTITWQGSNDNAAWHPMTQRGGTANMAYTTAALHSPNENPAFVRPIVVGGTSVVVKCAMSIHARYRETGY